MAHRVCPRVSRAAAPTAYSGRAAGYCGCAAPKERAARRALAASASHVAVEDGTPMSPDEDEAAVEEERAGDQRVWAQLVYNERHAAADQWFGEHAWTAVATPLADYLREMGRP
ncbi:MAG: hypothetical protein QOH34_2008, partial [Mycobacterium sp.]|nr:hypothetical protein [Mycobacterium sp.]